MRRKFQPTADRLDRRTLLSVFQPPAPLPMDTPLPPAIVAALPATSEAAGIAAGEAVLTAAGGETWGYGISGTW